MAFLWFWPLATHRRPWPHYGGVVGRSDDPTKGPALRGGGTEDWKKKKKIGKTWVFTSWWICGVAGGCQWCPKPREEWEEREEAGAYPGLQQAQPQFSMGSRRMPWTLTKGGKKREKTMQCSIIDKHTKEGVQFIKSPRALFLSKLIEDDSHHESSSSSFFCLSFLFADSCIYF